MLKVITQAAKNFFENDLELPIAHCDEIVKEGYISFITASTASDKYEVYLTCCNDFLKKISDVMLFDDNPDDDTMDDLNKELNNIIIGSAKVLSEQNSLPSFTISTPTSLGSKSFDIEYDSYQTLSIDKIRITIAVKQVQK